LWDEPKIIGETIACSPFSSCGFANQLGVNGVPLGFKQVWYSDLREIGSDNGGLLAVNIGLS